MGDSFITTPWTSTLEPGLGNPALSKPQQKWKQHCVYLGPAQGSRVSAPFLGSQRAISTAKSISDESRNAAQQCGSRGSQSGVPAPLVP